MTPDPNLVVEALRELQRDAPEGEVDVESAPHYWLTTVVPVVGRALPHAEAIADRESARPRTHRSGD